MRMRTVVAPSLLVFSVACSSGPEAPAPAAATAAPAPAAEKKYLLERVDDAAIVQLYADGFSELPLNEKRLI